MLIQFEANTKLLAQKEAIRKALLEKQRSQIIALKEQKRLDTEKRIQVVLVFHGSTR